MGIFHTILDIVFPSRCLGCGKNGTELCLECLSMSTTAERESENWIFPLYDYRDPKIKNAVWLLKYKGKKRLAKVFAEALYGRMLEELADLQIMENISDPLLIPIPLSPKRARERGFNQTELIADELLALDKENKILTIEKKVLFKPKDTEHQARIENRAKRLKNILGTFAVKNENRVADRNIILLDDVTTTGATLREAKKVLRRAGARRVVAFTVAH